MEKSKLLSIFKLIFFGYYLPMLAITIMPSMLFAISNPSKLLMAFVIPFWVMVMGLPMTLWFPFNDVWELYVGFAVSLGLFLTGCYHCNKKWGKVMVVIGLWGWTFASGLGMSMHG